MKEPLPSVLPLKSTTFGQGINRAMLMCFTLDDAKCSVKEAVNHQISLMLPAQGTPVG